MAKNEAASALATVICSIVDGQKREDVLAALTCATGRALASIGVPAEGLDACIELFAKQIKEHHAKYLEQVAALK